MKLNNKKKMISLIFFVLVLFSTTISASSISEKTIYSNLKIIPNSDKLDNNNILNYNQEDLDPLIDLKITVTIKEIRALDETDRNTNSDFYVKIIVNNQTFKSKVWFNQKYIYTPWSTGPLDVSDTEENVTIKIQLWDWNLGRDKLCDISNPDSEKYIDKRDLDLIYSLKTGSWTGDDFNYPSVNYGDPSGYGRANGCDDGSIRNDNDRDCELLFDITQNDYDNDTIPYWTEVNITKTDPTVNDLGRDDDLDGVPIEWELKWGHYFYYDWHQDTYRHVWIYDPFVWEDHKNLDIDNDGLQNVEEYLTSQWGSDPFRKDIFIEIDQMKEGPNGEGGFLPDLSKELVRDAFSRRNIVLGIDDGKMGGGELIPYDQTTTNQELQDIYWKYFLHLNKDNWRRGAFHYALLLYNASYAGFAFSSHINGTALGDCFQLSTKTHEWGPIFKYPLQNIIRRKSLNREYHRSIEYGGVLMHETGHILGIYGGNTPGCDITGILNYIKYHNYRSCMNYWYTYYLIDYSDGSHGKYDFDDWDRIDLTLFQIPHIEN